MECNKSSHLIKRNKTNNVIKNYYKLNKINYNNLRYLFT